MSHVLRRRPLWVLAVMIVLASPALAEVREEDTDFPPVADELAYSAGWVDAVINGSADTAHTIRLHYPAQVDGEDSPVTTGHDRGPIMLWWGGDERPLSDYDWVGQGLARTGVITVIFKPDWTLSDAIGLILDVAETRAWLTTLNATGGGAGDPAALQGHIDTRHWGVGGHAQGAALATVVQGWWHVYQAGSLTDAPRALIALAIDRSGLESVDWSPTWPHPQPSMGLFMTGSTDEMTPQDEHVDPFLATWPGSHIKAEVLGANHLQYRATDSFLERTFEDGRPTMTRDAQQAHAMERMRGLVDLTLRGALQGWYDLTARAGPGGSPSDPDAYLSAWLDEADFLRFGEVEITDGIIGPSTTITLHAAASQRDGGAITSAEVICRLPGGAEEAGWWAADASNASRPNGSAGCDFPSTRLASGTHGVELVVTIDGLPGRAKAIIERANAPPVVVHPPPELIVEERGTLVVDPTLVARDPDDAPLRWTLANTTGPNAAAVDADIDGGGRLVLSAILKPREPVELGLSVVLRESVGDAPFSVATDLTVHLVPVDDAVVLTAAPSTLAMDEDASGQWFDPAQYVSDPEGATVVISLLSASDGLNVSVDDDDLRIVPWPDWHGQATISISASDGTTAPLMLDLDVVVAPQADWPTLNVSALNLTVSEDDRLLIPWTGLGHDVDGDPVEFTVDDSGGPVLVEAWHDQLRITPPADWTGQDSTWRLGISDGEFSVTSEILVTVTPVNDPPMVTWSTWPSPGSEGLTLSWSMVDIDSDTGWELGFRWNDGSWERSPAGCAALGGGHVCSANVPVSSLEQTDNKLEVRILDGDDTSESTTEWVRLLTTEAPDQDLRAGAAALSPQWYALAAAALGFAALGLWLLLRTPDHPE